MSKRLEILNLRLQQLEANSRAQENRIQNLYNRSKKEMKRVLEDYFTPFNPEFRVEHNSESVNVYYGKSNYSFLDIYVNDSWVGDDRVYSRIDFSTSSSRIEFEGGEDFEWATKRFECLAYYANEINVNRFEILAKFNTINKKYNNLQSSLYDDSRAIRKACSDQYDAIKKLETQIMTEKLFSEDGISIVPEKDDNYLPTFSAKWDWDIKNVAGLKGIRKSASGKSVDLEVKRRFRDWQNDSFTFDTIKVERVRFDNVDMFLSRNKDLVS